ncbi:hypothetical protein ACHAXR_011371 [Thalassiosira sp. AJA248-18]
MNQNTKNLISMQEDCLSLKKDFGFASREQFHVKLYAMLEMAGLQALGSSNAVSWLPHGRAFKILDQQDFMEVVVPMFFKQKKIRSFYRQLNLWGFKRVLKGVDAGAWHNKFFLRGAPEEMKKMVRTKIKGSSSIHLDDQEVPDFYSMPSLPSVTTRPMSGELLRNRAEHRRVSMEGPAPVSEFQFIHNQAPNYHDERRRFPLPETSLPRHVSPLTHDISQLQGLPCTSCSSDCQASAYAISSGCYVGKSRFGVGLEPLPYYDGFHQATSHAVIPSDNEAKGNVITGLEPLPFDEDLPFDEFANYIENVIQIV